MSREHTGTNRERSEYYGALQDIVNALFAQYGDLDPTIAEAVGAKVRRLDVVVAAEAADLPEAKHYLTLFNNFQGGTMAIKLIAIDIDGTLLNSKQ